MEEISQTTRKLLLTTAQATSARSPDTCPVLDTDACAGSPGLSALVAVADAKPTRLAALAELVSGLMGDAAFSTACDKLRRNKQSEDRRLEVEQAAGSGDMDQAAMLGSGLYRLGVVNWNQGDEVGLDLGAKLASGGASIVASLNAEQQRRLLPNGVDVYILQGTEERSVNNGRELPAGYYGAKLSGDASGEGKRRSLLYSHAVGSYPIESQSIVLDADGRIPIRDATQMVVIHPVSLKRHRPTAEGRQEVLLERTSASTAVRAARSEARIRKKTQQQATRLIQQAGHVQSMNALSDYEKKRLLNIERNKALMKELGLTKQ